MKRIWSAEVMQNMEIYRFFGPRWIIRKQDIAVNRFSYSSREVRGESYARLRICFSHSHFLIAMNVCRVHYRDSYGLKMSSFSHEQKKRNTRRRFPVELDESLQVIAHVANVLSIHLAWPVYPLSTSIITVQRVRAHLRRMRYELMDECWQVHQLSI